MKPKSEEIITLPTEYADKGTMTDMSLLSLAGNTENVPTVSKKSAPKTPKKVRASGKQSQLPVHSESNADLILSIDKSVKPSESLRHS